MNPRVPPPAPQSFEEQISQVRLWSLALAMIAPILVLTLLLGHTGILEPAAMTQVQNKGVWVCGFLWWALKATPRPFSLRAALGHPGDLTVWAWVAALLVAQLCVAVVWWTAPFYWEALQSGGDLPRAFSFQLEDRGRTVSDLVLAWMVLAPLTEEVLCRGVLFRKWRVRWGAGVAAVLSTVVFAAGHGYYVAPFFSGLTYVLLYTRTRSLWAPMGLHFLNNSLSTARYYYWRDGHVRLGDGWWVGAFPLLLIVGTGLWLYFVCTSWRTLADPLPPDSLRGEPEGPAAPAELGRAGTAGVGSSARGAALQRPRSSRAVSG